MVVSGHPSQVLAVVRHGATRTGTTAALAEQQLAVRSLDGGPVERTDQRRDRRRALAALLIGLWRRDSTWRAHNPRGPGLLEQGIGIRAWS
jgi:hypothetical protein